MIIVYTVWDGGSLVSPWYGDDPDVVGDFCRLPVIYAGYPVL